MTIKTFACAAVASLAALISAPLAFGATWKRIESPHFVIYTDTSETIGRDYAGQLEAYDFAANKLFGEIGDSQVEDTHKYDFYLLDDIKEFRVVQPKIPNNAMTPTLSNSTYGAQFFSSRGLDGSGGGNDKRINDADLAYLLRSYTSVKIHQFFSYRLPGWVVGGLQDYFMMTHVESGKVLVGLPLPSLMLDETVPLDRSALGSSYGPSPVSSLIPLHDIVTGTYKSKDGGRLARFEGWVLINHFLTDPVAHGRFMTYLTRSQLGFDAWQNFTSTTGMTDEAFRALYVQYTTKGSPYLTYPLAVDTNADIKVEKLPDYGADVPLIQAALTGAPDDYGKSLLTKMEPIAAAHPEDDVTLRTMAIAEIDYGDPHRAAPYLDKLITHNPKSAESAFLKGRMFLVLAEKESGETSDKDYAAARDLLGQAYQLDPTNAHILAAFARAHANEKDYPDANTQQALELAQSYSGGAYNLLSAEFAVRTDHFDHALGIIGDWPEHTTDPVSKAAVQKVVDALKANRPKAEVLDLIEAYRNPPRP